VGWLIIVWSHYFSLYFWFLKLYSFNPGHDPFVSMVSFVVFDDPGTEITLTALLATAPDTHHFAPALNNPHG
jgi:hypothetical protein